MLSKTSLGVAAAGAGLCFLGYCIYFDRKRRSDPNFKQKLRERRRKAKLEPASSGGGAEFPDPNNKEACERFFIQEVQLGEELLASGSIEEGVDHLANAVVICGQPQQLIQVFGQTLPPPVVQMLMLKIPLVKQRLASHIADSAPSKKGPAVAVVEDDVE